MSCTAQETKMKQGNNLSISANPMISSLLIQFSKSQNNAYISGYHHMEYTEIKLAMLLEQGDGKAQL